MLDVMMPTMNGWEVIDVLKRRITRAGVRITLTHKEFALLYLFATHQGQVLSCSLIASRVWEG